MHEHEAKLSTILDSFERNYTQIAQKSLLIRDMQIMLAHNGLNLNASTMLAIFTSRGWQIRMEVHVNS